MLSKASESRTYHWLFLQFAVYSILGFPNLNGNTFQFANDGNPFQFPNDGIPFQLSNDGNPFQVQNDGNPIQIPKNGNPRLTSNVRNSKRGPKCDSPEATGVPKIRK